MIGSSNRSDAYLNFDQRMSYDEQRAGFDTLVCIFGDLDPLIYNTTRVDSICVSMSTSLYSLHLIKSVRLDLKFIHKRVYSYLHNAL